LSADKAAPTISEPIRIRGGYELLVSWEHSPSRTSLEALASTLRQVFVRNQIRTNMTTYPHPAQRREGKLVIIKIQIMNPSAAKKLNRHRKAMQAAREEINTLLPKVTLAVNENAEPITDRHQAPVRAQSVFRPAVATAGVRTR
jgi:hypothetical protein